VTVSRRVRAALRWVFLVGLLLAVTLPRFNLRDPGPIGRLTAGAKETPYGVPLDVAWYMRLVEYFRGHLPADSLLSPFCYRPLVPLVASRIPADPLTSINLVNLVCLLLTVLLLDRLLAKWGGTKAQRTWGSVLFIVSFPTFYYGTIGFVDPAAVFLITAGVLATVERRFGAQLVTIGAGVLVKETVGLVAGIELAWLWANREWSGKGALRVFTLAGVGVAILLGFRFLAPFPDPGYGWAPDLSRAIQNLSRSRAWISFFLTLGLPGLLAAVRLWSDRSRAEGRELRRFLGACCLMAVAVYFYSFISAYADGRLIWIIYPFAIPLAVAVGPFGSLIKIKPGPRAKDCGEPASHGSSHA
jgi:hypothetical protein